MTPDINSRARALVRQLFGEPSAWPQPQPDRDYETLVETVAIALRQVAAEAAKERDEWERKYNAISMGADPKASGTAKAYRDAVEMACNEALDRYKHEAREAQSTLASLRALLAEAGEALKPFAKAADGVELHDPNAPEEMAALRASFDWFTRSLGCNNDEIVHRDSVRLRDLRCARTALAAIQSALRDASPTTSARLASLQPEVAKREEGR